MKIRRATVKEIEEYNLHISHRSGNICTSYDQIVEIFGTPDVDIITNTVRWTLIIEGCRPAKLGGYFCRFNKNLPPKWRVVIIYHDLLANPKLGRTMSSDWKVLYWPTRTGSTKHGELVRKILTVDDFTLALYRQTGVLPE